MIEMKELTCGWGVTSPIQGYHHSCHFSCLPPVVSKRCFLVSSFVALRALGKPLAAWQYVISPVRRDSCPFSMFGRVNVYQIAIIFPASSDERLYRYGHIVLIAAELVEVLSICIGFSPVCLCDSLGGSSLREWREAMIEKPCMPYDFERANSLHVSIISTRL